MSVYDDYFIAQGIDYDEFENQVARLIHSQYFYDINDIVHRQLSIPSDATDRYYLFINPEQEHIVNIYGIQQGRIYNKEDDITFIEDDTYTDLTSYTETDQEEIIAGLHGKGILFKTDTDSQTVILTMTRTLKTASNMHQSFRDKLKIAYYYLLNENTDGFYATIRDLSYDKKNIQSEQKHKTEVLYKRTGKMTPYAL